MPRARRSSGGQRRDRGFDRRAGDRYTISVGAIRWGLGILTSLVVGYGAWKTVIWDDVKTYWRQEAIAAAKDKETDTKFKQLASDAQRGRAWLFWSVNDMKAQQQRQWAAACPALKQPTDVCEQWKADAKQYAEDAAAAKREAQKVGKVDAPD